MGPAIIGVSEVENITVMQDLARDEQLKAWNLQVLHHDSPDRRGIDVGFLFNPRLFRPLNVTHHTLVVESNPNFRTRDQSRPSSRRACKCDCQPLAVTSWRTKAVELPPRGSRSVVETYRRLRACHKS